MLKLMLCLPLMMPLVRPHSLTPPPARLFLKRDPPSALPPSHTLCFPNQMSSGFSRLLSAADDLVLDIPDAVHLLSLFLGR